MASETVASYLERLGFGAVPAPTAEALAALQSAHLHHVPFENLSIHLGETIALDQDAFVDKVVRRRRGGFCYELNGAFAALLVRLGYEVTLHSARVAVDRGRFGPPFDHLALTVRCPVDDDGAAWLVDVGFGDGPLWPLRLDAPESDAFGADPLGPAGLGIAPDGDVELSRADEVRYRLDLRPRRLAEFASMCRFHQTSAESHFTQGLVCTRRIPGGRITVSGRRRVVTVGADRTEEFLADDDQLGAVLREDFGVHLDRVPSLGDPGEAGAVT